MVNFKSEFSCYSVKFNPFNPRLLACATAQYFGIVGNGKQEILERSDRGLVPIAGFYTQDGLYDCAWSEESEHHLVSVSGDGSVKLWDIRHRQGRPIHAWKENRAELNSVSWSAQSKNLFLTSCWDGTIKLWSVSGAQSLRTFTEHEAAVYGVAWDPLQPDRFASVSGDGSVRVWDTRSPRGALRVGGHAGFEVLSLDWSPHEPATLVSGAVDKTVRIWDARRPQSPLFELHAHTYAVRRVRWCPAPQWRHMLISASYDRSLAIWDLERPSRGQDPLVERLALHQEFAVGCDFSRLQPGVAASCGWDGLVFHWTMGKDPTQ